MSASHPHWLDPLLAPRSIALVGGSPRPGTVGNLMLKSLVEGRFPGTLTVVNPKYTAVEDIDAVATLAELPEPADLAVLSVAAHRMERVMAEAIRAGVRAAVVFDACLLDGDGPPRLLERLGAMAREAGLPVCGGNGMGFYNYDSRTFASFQEPLDAPPGHIAAVCHSGSVFGILANEAGRFRFNLLASPGQEINGTLADYMDWALDQPTTRVLALFVEAVRDPESFVAALTRALDEGVPVVVAKVGRTPESARLAETHSGAMVGDDTAFDALCRRHGVLRADDLDDLMATAQILAAGKTVGEGGFAAILDSGGLREQLMDMAHDLGVPFAPLSQATTEALKATLDIGLEAVNPLDAAGRFNENLGGAISTCAAILERDPGVAILAHEYYRTDRHGGLPEIGEAILRLGAASAKPYVVSYALGAANNAAFANDMQDSGIPVINGTGPLLKAVRHAFAWRDFLGRDDTPPEAPRDDAVGRWRERLGAGAALAEPVVLEMLRDFGIDTAASLLVHSTDEAAAAARATGYPVALKTAVPGLVHKTDAGGVHLGIADESALRAAARSLEAFGPAMSVAGMVPGGVEVAFGMARDPHWGPVVMVGAGGTLVELLDDRAAALAPFGPEEARRLVDSLKVSRLLAGARSGPPCDSARLALMLSRFSVACHALADVIAEMDVNPLIVGGDFARAVDAVLIPAGNCTTVTASRS